MGSIPPLHLSHAPHNCGEDQAAGLRKHHPQEYPLAHFQFLNQISPAQPVPGQSLLPTLAASKTTNLLTCARHSLLRKSCGRGGLPKSDQQCSLGGADLVCEEGEDPLVKVLDPSDGVRLLNLISDIFLCGKYAQHEHELQRGGKGARD